MNLNSSYLMLLLFTIAFLTRCSNNNSENDNLSLHEDSSISLLDSGSYNKTVVDTIPVTSNKQIMGKLISLGKESLTVEITNGKFIYKEHNESHNFRIKSDSIYIYYHDFSLSGKPYLINDTLVIVSGTGDIEGKYIRQEINAANMGF